MPKEQGHPGERLPRDTSKKAKDKSNSATLLASQSKGMHRAPQGMGTNRRISRCDSEKDSGYSEAGSDSVQTDLDDQRSSVSGRGHRNGGGSSGPSLPAYEEVAPVYVIKNLLVKSSGPEQVLQSPLRWGGGWHGLPSAQQAPGQLLLIQQPVAPPPNPARVTPSSGQPEPQSRQAQGGGGVGGGGRRSKNHNSGVDSYLPILKSYPRIAPHPRKEGVVQGQTGATGGATEGQSQSKRVCTEGEKREAVSTSTRRPQKIGRTRPRCSPSPQPPRRSQGGHAPSSTTSSSSNQKRPHHRAKPRPSASRSDSTGSPSVSSSQTSSPPSSSSAGTSSSSSPRGGAGLSDSQSERSSVRRRHFQNTTELLSRSGLLGVTLRTKELLRQNAATERDIAQLREHAQLLCLAVGGQGGPPDPAESTRTLDTLLETMTRSGSYPSLDWGQVKGVDRHRETGDETQGEEGGRGGGRDDGPPPNAAGAGYNGTSPPSPLFAPSPAPDGAYLDHAPSISPPPAWLHPVQEQRRRGGVKPAFDLIVPPDSSTHKQYLL